MNQNLPSTFLILIFLICFSCTSENESTLTSYQEKEIILDPHFKLLKTETNGVNFQNTIVENKKYNILNYEYLYNGGGVAIGDINNDGLPDIYFTGTFVSNQLFLNKGNLKFENITESAGVAAAEGFKTGVTMVDINHDGWLDIYVCRTSKEDNGQKNNLLFINNKNSTFTEKSAAYGLKDNSNSNHANFFDFDNDGDLDLYILNHRLDFSEALHPRVKIGNDGKMNLVKHIKTPFESDKFYLNDNGNFIDISEKVGIQNSTFGLSATVADLNKDGYLDIFIGNDYVDPDHVFINNKNGTFSDKNELYVRHTSHNSMGCDIADINNDGLLDITVMDMVADDHVRYKQLGNTMKKDKYNKFLEIGLGHQVMRNVLQVNNGNNTFSEMGQLAGISNTDWSWGALIADFDNDGWKDMYITNGYKRDVTDMDYSSFTIDSINRVDGGIDWGSPEKINNFLNLIPSKKLTNYLFKNNTDFTFSNVSKSWGITEPSFSNGAAYADLDLDGDLDIVVNNIDEYAFVYENISPKSNYLQIDLKGSKKNPNALGAKVKIFTGDQSQYIEKTVNRGFFSCSDQILHFGLGDFSKVDKVEIKWLGGKSTILENVEANQKITVKLDEANNKTITNEKLDIVFEEKSKELNINFTHQENTFDDFNRERLIPHKLSNLGPYISKADVNNDGLEDFFIGGAFNNAAKLFLQKSNSTFEETSIAIWENDKSFEDLESVFFDADGDNDLDLYVASGGNAAVQNSQLYQDRLYLNDGNGNFTKSQDALPKNFSSNLSVAAYDFDKDGDDDIFVGGRSVPGRYPTNPRSCILKNEQGKFIDVTEEIASDFINIGMVSDIHFNDLDNDNQEEMIVTGEYLPISIFRLSGGKFKNVTNEFGLKNTNGWWNCISIQDFDKDGDLDIMAGNLGKNTRLKASPNQPMRLYAQDFDANGSIDPILTYSYKGNFFPLPLRDNIIAQLPVLKKKFLRYRTYSKAKISDVFTSDQLSKAQKLDVHIFESVLFENNNGKFSKFILPQEAQVAPINEILSTDLNGDGLLDIVGVGNTNAAEVETGVYDASNGTILLGNKNNEFKSVPNYKTGLWINKQARDIVDLKLANGNSVFLVANNNGQMQVFVQNKQIIN